MISQLLFQIVFVVLLHRGLVRTNLALHKPTTQSSTLDYIFNWTSDKAVDGNTSGSDPENSRTCSSTEKYGKHIWEVDIGFQIILKNITVYGRTGTGNGAGLWGITMYFSNASGPLIYAERLVNNPHVYTPNYTIASVVSLTKTGDYMIICEVTIEGECIRGKYGYNCNETCGKCLYGNDNCSTSDGICTNGCQAGWQGLQCKTCERGKYGYECNNTCGKCLYGNDNCSTSDGNCTNGCQAGWQGLQCNKTCERGMYGYDCNNTCGMCLYGNNSCSTSDGTCTNGCEAGWQGLKCDKECLAGTYGLNCGENCGYCLNGSNNCSKIDGLCTGGCLADWMGKQCKQASLKNPQNGIETSIIGGSVGGAVALVVLIVVIVVIIFHRRRKKTNLERRADELTTVPQYANLVVGNPDAAFKITDRSQAETNSAYLPKEEESIANIIPISMKNSHTEVMGPHIYIYIYTNT